MFDPQPPNAVGLRRSSAPCAKLQFSLKVHVPASNVMQSLVFCRELVAEGRGLGIHPACGFRELNGKSGWRGRASKVFTLFCSDSEDKLSWWALGLAELLTLSHTWSGVGLDPCAGGETGLYFGSSNGHSSRFISARDTAFKKSGYCESFVANYDGIVDDILMWRSSFDQISPHIRWRKV